MRTAPRILFIGPAPIGDTILTTGALEHLRIQYPDARFTLALSPATTGLFRAFPGLERTLVLRKQPNGMHWWDLWRATFGTRWDVTVDLRGSATTRLLRARTRFIRQGGVRPGVRAADDAAAVLGLDSSPPLALHTDRAADTAIAPLLPTDGRPVLALAPGSNWLPKRWPPDRFAALAAALTAEGGPLPNARIIVLGGPGEEAMTAAVAAALRDQDVVDLAGTLPLLDTAALFARTRLFVGNDSGLMHLAAAVGAPTLGLFGPTDDVRYAPFGPFAAHVRGPRTYADAMALFRAGETERSLLDDLTVDRALTAATTLLETSKPWQPRTLT